MYKNYWLSERRIFLRSNQNNDILAHTVCTIHCMLLCVCILCAMVNVVHKYPIFCTMYHVHNNKNMVDAQQVVYMMS